MSNAHNIMSYNKLLQGHKMGLVDRKCIPGVLLISLPVELLP